ncbi:MAG: FtsX-like permease family protein [Ferruginibacter sp.]
MIKNYFRVAIRNLGKYKFTSFINLFGLSIGFTCCLLILLFVTNELSFDRYNHNADRIYRVTRSFHSPEGKQWLHLGTIAPPFGPLIQNDFPDIRKITRLLPNSTTPFRYKEKIFNEEKAFYADENLFDVFDVNLTRGNPATALNDPYCVLLSETMAKKYFDNEDPINKIIRQDNSTNYKVTGTFKSFPSNAHIHPEILLSFNTLRDSAVYGEKELKTNWGNNSFFTYLLLPPNYPAKNIEAQFPAFLDKHFPTKPNQPVKPSKTTSLYLQKLTDIHLRSHLDYEAEENGDIKRVYIFSAIALFILLIACINYMNLSTARSVLRAREIGIRKAIGAQRREIIAQFLGESVLITTIALVLSLIFTWLAIPWLNKISGQQLNFAPIANWKLIIPLIFIPFVVGIISGLYPAFFMSSFQPVKVLKGIPRVQTGKFSFRQVLVVTQFFVSIILIICTAIVFQQLRYMQKISLGFDREHIVTIPYNNSLNPQFETFRTELLQDPAIKNLSRSSRIPTGRLLDAMDAAIPVGDTVAPIKADIKFVAADYDFIPTYGVAMAAGRNFSRDYGMDSASFIVNEVTVRTLGFSTPGEVTGKPFIYSGIRGKIIGVMKDFHFESMHERIIPLVLVMPAAGENFYSRMSVKISGNDIPGAMAKIEKTWKRFLPGTPFDYTFLDENFDRLYQAENRQASLFTIFSSLAIFIACLGLFGLSAFTITQRIKEIGIRKVLGASISNIVRMISKDFLKLVVIAALLAFPVAWYVMHEWLQDFAYRIGISWWVFVLAAVIALLIALLTVSFQAIKAAVVNPVESLRTE